MKLRENSYISAYNKLDKIVEGRVALSPSGTQIVISEDGRKYPLSNLKAIRLIEDDEGGVQAKVEDDLNNCDEDKLKSTSDEDLEKAGEAREKELKDAGMDIKDGEYKTAFVSAAKAKSALEDAEKGNISNSEALKELTESEEAEHPINEVSIDDEFFKDVNTTADETTVEDYNEENLDSDYHDVPPYDDDMLYEQVNHVIDDYTSSVKVFNEQELFDRMCDSFCVRVERTESLSESIRNILKAYKSRKN